MSATIIVDIDSDYSEVFQEFCLENGVTVTHLEVHGPAGGNPRFTLFVNTEKAMLALTTRLFN